MGRHERDRMATLTVTVPAETHNEVDELGSPPT